MHTDWTAGLKESRLRGSVCAKCRRRVLAADRTAQSPRQLLLLRASIFPSSSFLSLSSEPWAVHAVEYSGNHCSLGFPVGSAEASPRWHRSGILLPPTPASSADPRGLPHQPSSSISMQKASRGHRWVPKLIYLHGERAHPVVWSIRWAGQRTVSLACRKRRRYQVVREDRVARQMMDPGPSLRPSLKC